MEDVEALGDFISPNFINYAPCNNFMGRKYTNEDLKNGRMRFHNMKPDDHYEIEEAATEGNKTFIIANRTFTHIDTIPTRLGKAPHFGKKFHAKW